MAPSCLHAVPKVVCTAQGQISLLRKTEMVSERVLKRRVAVERWKVRNREKYLQQKRELGHRPEYLARRRELYRIKREAFIREHGLPRRGRPPCSCTQETYPWLRKLLIDESEERSTAGDRFCDLSECSAENN